MKKFEEIRKKISFRLPEKLFALPLQSLVALINDFVINWIATPHIVMLVMTVVFSGSLNAWLASCSPYRLRKGKKTDFV